MRGVFASLRRTSKQTEAMQLTTTTTTTNDETGSEWEDERGQERKTALHLQLYDVSHAGVQAFLRCLNTHPDVIQTSLDTVNALLYDGIRHKARRRQNVPRSITIKVRSMDGVAYTTGKVLDDEHKEIHFSAEYIDGIAKRCEAKTIESASKPTPTSTTTASAPKATAVSQPARDTLTFATKNTLAEVRGVLVHEIVHAVQFTGKGSCPGGLIEGIADWVRLKAGLAPPHWSPHRGGDEKKVRWDAGYSTTETRLKVPDLVPLLNQTLATRQWSDGEALSRAAKQVVDLEQLWKEYCRRESGSG